MIHSDWFIATSWLVAASWVAFAAYWLISARSVKRNIGRRPWKQEIWVRVVIIVCAIFVIRTPALRHALWQAQRFVDEGGLVLALIGAVLCVSGIAFAIWARVYLGRNWGMPMSRKEDPELVTSGPYAHVRHPIYGGLLIAMLGSALSVTILWLILVPLCAAYFAYSARNEERLMLEQFPEQYLAYMKRTKRFVPFVI